MKRIIFILFILFTGSLLPAEVFVVANASNPSDTIKKKELKEIFLGEKVLWDDGSKIKIADNLERDVSKEFYDMYVGTKVVWVRKVWIRKMLRGKMSPPESFKSSNRLLDFISTEKQSIGFVSKAKLPEGVKKLKVVD